MTLRKVSDSNGQSPVVLINLANFTKQSVFSFHILVINMGVASSTPLDPTTPTGCNCFTHCFARESDFKMHSVTYYHVKYGIPPQHAFLCVYIYMHVRIKYIYTHWKRILFAYCMWIYVYTVDRNLYIYIHTITEYMHTYRGVTSEPLRPWSGTPDPYLGPNGRLEGLQEVAKETSSKSQLPAGVGGVHLLDCGYMGSPTDWIPTYCVFHLSAPRNITYQTMMR